jgi:molybdopterin synthase sulfur carrier subunit
MARVFIPAQWRDLTSGAAEVELPGTTLDEIVRGLDARFPGIAARLCDGDSIAAGLAVSIDDTVTARGLRTPVLDASEIHFLPAIGGG